MFYFFSLGEESLLPFVVRYAHAVFLNFEHDKAGPRMSGLRCLHVG